ncbi:MAG: YkvA family protein [Anaerolineae bacterium]
MIRRNQVVEAWKQRARQLKTETYALYLAYKDPRVRWYARVFAACVVGYAFSPIDLIPDPIPVLGYLDDLILIPLGVALALKMIPPVVMAEYREKAQVVMSQGNPTNWVAAAIIVAIWLLLATLVIILITQIVNQYSFHPKFVVKP